MAAKISAAWTISASVVVRPREKRTPLEARVSARPIAFRTWEGSSEPEEQAEPLEAATPLRSRFISRVVPSAPGTETFTLLGRRRVGWPFRIRSGNGGAKQGEEPVAQGREMCANPQSRRARLSSAALPKPTSAATFSVPARFSRSCAPPCI